MKGPHLAASVFLLWTSLLLAPARAAECRLRGQPFLEGRVRGAGPLARHVDARLGEQIEVFLVLPGTLSGRPVLFSEDGGRGRVSWAAAGCGPLSVSFYRVEPRMEHTLTPAKNRDIRVYANAVVFGPSHGKWLGFDRLEYVASPLPDEGPVLLLRDARPSGASGVVQRDPALQALGTMRLSATVRAAEKERSTPGLSPGDGDTPGGQISDRVFRYTFRQGDGFLGWLTAYFNVPYLFGSAGKGEASQAARHVGADCADVLVAALRRTGVRMDYTSVSGLIGALRPVAGPVLVHPCDGACPKDPGARLAVPRDVRPGDLLALDYVGADSLPRSWDHIGVFVEDRGPDGPPDGWLGPEDLFADSGSAAGLKFAPLGEQGTIRLVVLRPRGTE